MDDNTNGKAGKEQGGNEQKPPAMNPPANNVVETTKYSKLIVLGTVGVASVIVVAISVYSWNKIEEQQKVMELQEKFFNQEQQNSSWNDSLKNWSLSGLTGLTGGSFVAGVTAAAIGVATGPVIAIAAPVSACVGVGGYGLYKWVFK